MTETNQGMAQAARLRRAVVALARRLRAQRAPEGLSPNRLVVLAHLYRHGSATPGQIAAAEHQLPQSLTRTLAELERAGLLSRGQHPEDRRQWLLAITQAGRLALERDAAERDAWLAAGLDSLGPTERQVLTLAGDIMERLAAWDPEKPLETIMRHGASTAPDWVRHAVWWQLYPLGFLGAEPRALPGAQVIHRLGRLEPWLDYAVELGASGLLLGPLFASATHGYDTSDHFRIDPRLGDLGDFDALVAAARTRGLRILLDGVFNHVGRDFGPFREALAQGPGGEASQWFRLRWPADWSPGAEPDYDCFEGHRHLVALNHASPAVADHVASVLTYWLERGVDGWRLDAAYAVPPEFWAEVLPRVRARFPQAWFLGEMIHGDYADRVSRGGLDSVTQYELWKAIWSSLNDANFFELAWCLDRHNALLEHFAPQTFVGNHDVTRLASRLEDARHLPHALVVLFTAGGVPSVYAGDEQGFLGVKEDRAGGDDAVRPAFPERPEQLAPFGWPIYRLHQDLIGLRRRHVWLHRARYAPVKLDNRSFSYRLEAGEQRLWVALNLTDAPARLPVEAAGRLLVGSGELSGPVDRRVVALAPHGWAILGPVMA